jgi:acyl-CoA reductase-like NAD-dependent aldehyde dehydrogenase
MTSKVTEELTTYQNFIGGVWRPACASELVVSINPATGESLALAQQSGEEDARLAVQAASDAFQHADWAYNPRKRSTAMLAWVARLERRVEDLARL